MEMEQKIAKVKKDLRDIRKLAHSITAAMRVREHHQRRLDYINEQSILVPELAAESTSIHCIMESLHIDEAIKRATALESRYMDIINTFEPLDRAIILDAYINGKAYWKIGREIGYTERGVQKRLDAIVRKIADKI